MKLLVSAWPSPSPTPVAIWGVKDRPLSSASAFHISHENKKRTCGSLSLVAACPHVPLRRRRWPCRVWGKGRTFHPPPAGSPGCTMASPLHSSLGPLAYGPGSWVLHRPAGWVTVQDQAGGDPRGLSIAEHSEAYGHPGVPAGADAWAGGESSARNLNFFLFEWHRNRHREPIC